MTIEPGPADRDFESVLKKSIPYAVSEFAAVGTNIHTGELKMKLAAALRGSVSNHPDYSEDFEEGQKLRYSSKLKNRSSDAENFWLRSFLYGGLAAARELPLVPDAIRTEGVSQLGSPPDDYAQRLKEAVEKKYPKEKLQSHHCGCADFNDTVCRRRVSSSAQ